jgi:ABC-type antimicrobial peptide transport system permease subunit
MKGSLKRLLALLIALLAILLGVASLFSRSHWLPVFSWEVMALSLGLALGLSFVAGFAAAALVQFLFSRAARRVSQV